MADSWYVDLVLARDFFGPHFGTIVVLAPSVPVSEAVSDDLREVDGSEGIRLEPSFDGLSRGRDFWFRGGVRIWLCDVRRLLAEARILHSSVVDPLKPICFLSFREARRVGCKTVMIGPDTEPWEDRRHISGHSVVGRFSGFLRTLLRDRMFRWAAKRADITMLKEGLVYDRYSQVTTRSRAFCHTMYTQDQVISSKDLEKRLSTLNEDRPIRLVFCGRLISRKGLLDNLRMMEASGGSGTHVQFDIIGDGEQKSELEEYVLSRGLNVRFLGFIPYGPILFDKLKEYDAMVFTPTREETARSTYDAFAAGLPLIASDIPFLVHRAKSDKASEIIPIGDIEAGAILLSHLDSNRETLKTLARNARKAGEFHTVANWYRRRMEWTLEAADGSERTP